MHCLTFMSKTQLLSCFPSFIRASNDPRDVYITLEFPLKGQDILYRLPRPPGSSGSQGSSFTPKLHTPTLCVFTFQPGPRLPPLQALCSPPPRCSTVSWTPSPRARSLPRLGTQRPPLHGAPSPPPSRFILPVIPGRFLASSGLVHEQWEGSPGFPRVRPPSCGARTEADGSGTAPVSTRSTHREV